MTSIRYNIKRADEIITNQGYSAFYRSCINYISKRMTARSQYYQYKLKYGSAFPAPSKIIYVNPTNIEYKLTPFFWKELNTRTTHVKNGEWDANRSEFNYSSDNRMLFKIENWTLYTSMQEHFLKGKAWKETEEYKRKSKSMDSENLDEYFQKIDDLYESIRRDGYKMQKHLGDSGSNHRKSWHHECAINICRDGTMALDDGRHRFCLAKLLQIESIPVRIFVRHSGWMDIIKEIDNSPSVNCLSERARKNLTHPDIVDVSNQKGFN